MKHTKTWISAGGENCAVLESNHLNGPAEYRIGESLPGDTLTTEEITNGLGEVLGIPGVPFLLDRGLPDSPGIWHLTESGGRGSRTIAAVEFFGYYREAREQFIAWALDFLRQISGEDAHDLFVDLQNAWCFSGGFDTFTFSGRTYGFIRVASHSAAGGLV